MAATLSGRIEVGGCDIITNIQQTAPLSKAAEAASNINALLIAKGKLQPSQLGRAPAPKKPQQPMKKKFDAEVEINDAPIICRDILTRNAKHEEISKKSGAYISTKGRYVTPEQRSAAEFNRERPLYLYIQAATEDSVQRAVSEINEVILNHGGMVNQTRGSTISVTAPPLVEHFNPILPPIASESSMLAGGPPQQPNMSQPPPISNLAYPHQPGVPQSLAGQVSQIAFIEEKMFIGLEHAPPSFDVRGKVIGAEGIFLQHIHGESGAIVTLRGRNSGYLDPTTAQESTEPMHIHLKHMTEGGLEQAKRLANDLIKTVQSDYSQFQREIALHPPSHLVAGHHVVGSIASLVSRQMDGTLMYSQSDPRVVLTSAPALSIAPPIHSVVLSQEHMNYGGSRPPTYVQAVPPTPLYNSFASSGMEFVHHALPSSRPVTSILRPLIPHDRELNSEAPQTILAYPDTGELALPPNLHVTQHQPPASGEQTIPLAGNIPSQPAYHSIPHQPVLLNSHPAQTHAVMTSHPPPDTIMSLPPPTVISNQAPAPVYIASQSLPLPSNISNHPPPVMTSRPPPAIITGHLPPPAPNHHPPNTVLISNQPPPQHQPTVITSLALADQQLVIVSNPQQTIAMQQDGQLPIVSFSTLPTTMIHEGPPDTLTYIVQQPTPLAPVETQLMCIEQADMSVPPPNAVLAKPPLSAHRPFQPFTVNEYGQPVEVLELIQPTSQPSLHIVPQTAGLHIPPSYPPPPGQTSGETALPPPNLMERGMQSNSSPHLPTHRPHSSLPPIEPPPHLADGYRSNKGVYDGEREYYSPGVQHRPPYIGSRRPYSAITPPPPPPISPTDGQPMHKRWHGDGPRHHLPPPPPPPPL